MRLSAKAVEHFSPDDGLARDGQQGSDYGHRCKRFVVLPQSLYDHCR